LPPERNRWSAFKGEINEVATAAGTSPASQPNLTATQDAAFDRHLITLDEDFRLVLIKHLRDHCTHETLRENFLRFEGKKFDLPERFAPDRDFLDRHREGLVV